MPLIVSILSSSPTCCRTHAQDFAFMAPPRYRVRHAILFHVRFGSMTSTAPAKTDIALRDGSTMQVRPSTTEDVGQLRVFLESLSERSRWFRFFSTGVDLDAVARSAADPVDGLSLIA